MSETIDDLLRSLKVTAGSRFNAAKRLSHIDKWMTTLTSFASAYLILLAVGPSLLSLPGRYEPWVDMFTVAISVLLLASSVSSYSAGYAVKAEQHHRSALEIQELRRELRFIGESVGTDQLIRISQSYNAILQKYSINHDDADFFRFQLEYPDIYQLNWFDRLRKTCTVISAVHYPAAALVIITGIVMGFSTFVVASEVYKPPSHFISPVQPNG
ncbi:SLATT domain-containing protein [Cereibacter sp. SYSU M97828]|nr:SLATT domain-containing protein [Cereibacter flavus]